MIKIFVCDKCKATSIYELKDGQKQFTYTCFACRTKQTKKRFNK